MQFHLNCVLVTTAKVISLQSALLETGCYWSFLIMRRITPCRIFN